MSKREKEESAESPVVAEDLEAHNDDARAAALRPRLDALLAPLRALLPKESADHFAESIEDFALVHPVMSELADRLTSRAAPHESGTVVKKGAKPKKKTGTGGETP